MEKVGKGRKGCEAGPSIFSLDKFRATMLLPTTMLLPATKHTSTLVLICCQLHSTARGLVAPPAVRSELWRATVHSCGPCSAAACGSRLSMHCSAPARGRPILMKAPHRGFRLSDWYGQDWDHKKPAGDLWVSPWAKAHYKLRQQEIEIEQCEFMLQHAVDNEDYEEADGLKTRVERLRSQHPILPREERLADALKEGNFALANSMPPRLVLPCTHHVLTVYLPLSTSYVQSSVTTSRASR